MKHISPATKSHVVYTIAVIGFVYTIHVVLPMYSSSSFLNLFVSEKTVGFIYMASSAATILAFLFVPFFIRKLGNYLIALLLIILQMGLFYGLTATMDVRLISIFFIIQMAVVAVIGFCLDIFLEVYSDKAHIGVIRGIYMTSINSAWVIGPLVGSLIIGSENDYRSVYIASLFMLFPLFYLVYKNFPKFKDPHYSHPPFIQTLSHFLKNPNHSRLFIANSILQIFYSWMVVYSPIYLHSLIGFSWAQIGIIFTVMLIPFPLIEWPLGRLADKKYGEKEIMFIGFAILGLATMALAAINSQSVLIWALGLFTTRVGAAGAEIMLETYFFKIVDIKDSNMLGFFRITRSISFFIAPLIAGIMLIFTSDQSYQFIAIGLLCLCALIPVWKLRDTQ